MSDDDLLARGAELEQTLAEIRSEIERLEPEVNKAWTKLRKSFLPVGAGTLGGLGGIALAIPTGGWSLLVAALSAIPAFAQMREAGADYHEYAPLQQRLTFLVKLVRETAEEFEAVTLEMNRRA